MVRIEYETLLGKHSSIVKEVIGNDFDNKLFDKNFYYLKNENLKKNLHGINYNTISISSDKNEIIESVTVHFSSIINKEFYEKLNQIYGLPKEIKVISKREIVSESNDNDTFFSQNMRKSNIELQNGSFEENPLYIIWNKDNFEIIIFTRHNIGISEITFKVKN